MKKSIDWQRVLLLILLVCSSAFATRWEGQLTFNSSHIWRGFDLNPSQQPVLQPALGYCFGNSGLALSLWGSFSFVSRDAHELDLSLSYTRTFAEGLFVKIGVTGMLWDLNTDDRFARKNSREVFVSFGCSSCGIHPRFTVFYDFGDGDGFYLQADMTYHQHIARNWSGALFVSAGYNGGQWLAEGAETGVSDVNAGISISFGWGRWRITPHAVYTFGLLEALGKKDYFFYGISVTFGVPARFPGIKWF
jgi:hypothetical protein